MKQKSKFRRKKLEKNRDGEKLFSERYPKKKQEELSRIPDERGVDLAVGLQEDGEGHDVGRAQLAELQPILHLLFVGPEEHLLRERF